MIREKGTKGEKEMIGKRRRCEEEKKEEEINREGKKKGEVELNRKQEEEC